MGSYHEYCSGGLNPDDVVITGIAGRFPYCRNVGELKHSIYSGDKDLMAPSEERFSKGACGVPMTARGLISDLDKIEGDFFYLPQSTIHLTTPQCRKALETSYEAIMDAGYEPSTLRGARIGVYHGAVSNDSHAILHAESNSSMFHWIMSATPGRIAYALDFTGPSFSMDSACSTSATAFWTAVQDIRSGAADAALVTATQVDLDPGLFLVYLKHRVLSLTGNSAPFDQAGDGIIKCEGVSSIFLQKASAARRVYATVISELCTTSGYVPEGISVPSYPMQVQLTRETLQRTGVSADDIGYVELHATGTAVGDPIELNAIADVCCERRTRPLPIASVKSHIGHTEAASGANGVIAAVLAMETGEIAPSFRYRSPNPACTALLEGRIQVVQRPTPLDAPYVVVNSFGITGGNVQILLKQNPKTAPPSQKEPVKPQLPRLVFYPATTQEAIETVFEFVRTSPDLTDEFFALLGQLSFSPSYLKPLRGYAILDGSETPFTDIKRCSPEKRQVWFVFPGMGCQWAGMGVRMMSVGVFRDSMLRSAALLRPFGLDLLEVIAAGSGHLEGCDDTTPIFCALTAIQMALVDTLRWVGMEADFIVAHSAGEVAAAYADGCVSQDQALLAAYQRGAVIDVITDAPEGAMAAVGLSWAEAERRCPEGVWPACDNSADSVTVAGHKGALDAFAQQMQREGVFVKVVPSYGRAFHCPLVVDAANAMLPQLKKVFPNPKPRSSRWISCTFPESEWQHPHCHLVGAEYFAKNMASPVLFREALEHIPKDAITIEIGPHNLLRAILNRAIGTQATHIGLMRRNDPDNVKVFFHALGQMYTAGLEPKIEKLYPPVQFPVSRATPIISDLVRWDYSKSFPIPKWSSNTSTCQREFQLETKDSYLLDHAVEGRPLFPAAGYLWLAWEAMAKKCQKDMEEMPVAIENFKIHKATLIGQNATVKFFVNILSSSGHFEIMEGNSLVASGQVSEWRNTTAFAEQEPKPRELKDAVSGREIYNEMKMVGYEHGPSFQRIININTDGSFGSVNWNGKWIPFLDTLLMFFSTTAQPSFRLPTALLHLKLDPRQLKQYIEQKTSHENIEIPVSFCKDTNICRTVGIECAGLVMEPAVHRPANVQCVYDEYRFVPYFTSCTDLGIGFHTHLRKYAKACDGIVDQIGKAFAMGVGDYKFLPNSKSEHLEESESEFGENCVLLETLEKLLKNHGNLNASGKKLFSTYAAASGRDPASSANLISEDTLRLMAQVVSENNFRKLNVTEVSRGFPIVLPTLESIFQKFSNVKIKNSVLVPLKDFFSGEIPSDIQVRDESIFEAEDQTQDFVVTSFLSGPKSQLENLLKSVTRLLKPGGFVLLFHKESLSPPEKLICTLCKDQLQLSSPIALEKILQERHLVVISKISDISGVSLYLLRSVIPLVPPIVMPIEDDGKFEFVEKLKSLLATSKNERIWVVAEDRTSNGIVGMINCLKQEPGGENVRCVFIPPTKKGSKAPAFSFENAFFRDLLEKDLMMNVYKDGIWGSFKHFQIDTVKRVREVAHSYVTCGKYGDLSTLQWRESNLGFTDPEDRRLVHVYYSSLNFRDVMLATGKLSVAAVQAEKLSGEDESVLGYEFSGRDSLGQRVAGILLCGGMATSALVRPTTCLTLPNSWTLEEGATVPVVYSTSYYALLIRGQLSRGDSVLIHSGTGGVGQAAIHIARSLDCQIYTTVGNESKRKYLLKKFPTLKEENIGCSRDTSFEQMVMRGTNGRGVDVVLNSLADEKFMASVRCVAQNGRFVEIGKYDISLDRPMGMKFFTRNASFHGVMLDALLAPQCRDALREVFQMVRDGITSGVVQPLDRTIFDRTRLEDAFRYMAKGVHVGKVLLRIRDEESARHTLPTPLHLPALPISYFYPNKVYLVIGGLGGFGVEVAKWLISNGAKHLILTTRQSKRTPYHAMCLQRWSESGSDVRVSTLNAARRNEAERLLKEAAAIGPVGGIINSAVVLQDGFFDYQTAPRFSEACLPKAQATRHLDELSRALCPQLDLFVCFSSISCGKGNAGQTNYGFANSTMERVCEDRVADGLPGLAIQWGIIGEVGLVHRSMGDDARIAGLTAQSVRSCLQALDRFLLDGRTVVSSYVLAAAAPPAAHRADAVGDTLNMLAKTLGLKDVSEINPSRKFGEMGIDSMLGVELKTQLEGASGLDLSLQEILDMRLDDIRALLQASKDQAQQKAEASAKTPATALTIPSSRSLNLPAKLHHDAALVSLPSSSKGGIPPLVVVSAGDVDAETFSTLAAALRSPVHVLQWTSDTPSSSLADAAHWFLKVLEKKVGSAFHLLGFDALGGVVAFEMAARSQQVASVSLLDGSHLLRETLSGGETSKQAETIFLEQFVPEGLPQLDEQLSKLESGEQRSQLLLDLLTRSASEPPVKGELKAALTAHALKCGLARAHAPSKPFAHDLLLLEDPGKLLANDVTEVKRLLSQVCTGKIIVHRVFSRNEMANMDSIKRLCEVLPVEIKK